MYSKSSKILLFGVIILLIGALGVWSYQNLQKRVQNNTIPGQEVPDTTVSGTSLYTDPTLGFSLEIPNSWKGRYTTTQEAVAPLPSAPATSVRFDFSEGGVTTPLFYVAKTEASAWPRFMALSSRLMVKLLQVGDVVYYTEDARTYPPMRGSTFTEGTPDQYKSMLSDVETILSTFTFFDGRTGIDIRNTKETKSDETQKLELDLEYPVFQSSRVSVTGLNQEVQNKIDTIVSEFEKSLEDENLPLDIDSEMKNGVWIDYEIRNLSEKIVSIRFDISQYVRGAAHPNNFTQVLNYRLSDGKVLKLTDIFKPESKYLQQISKFTAEDLKKQLEKIDAYSEDAVSAGTSPKEENFQNVLLLPHEVEVIFDPYQVGPYALGVQSTRIPLEKLKSFIQPEFLP